MEQKRDMTAERIAEYHEELEIIQEGIEVYKTKVGQAEKGSRADTKYECRRKLFELKQEHKSKTAAMLQLQDLMEKARDQMGLEMDHMKKHWSSNLTKAMGMKNRFRTDNRRIVEGIKKADSDEGWKTDEHKLIAYKTLLNIMKNDGNGK